ncbi:MAG: CHAT domain-containing protein [Chloroflexaceae bacterium]|nr:CHAT domain-containing protein [Chloroflexaceae bacterium]NJO06998.1 CHAT domain-containing protein [Chloroflexaceae bacterium]
MTGESLGRDSAEFDISLRRRDDTSYFVDVRFTEPGSVSDVRPLMDTPALARINRSRLRELELDAAEYGRELSAGLFADEPVRAAFGRAQSIATTHEVPLRVRLFIDPAARDLHELRWETLRDPTTNTMLGTNERILFSRYLSSGSWRPVRLRPRTGLRVLVLVANPRNLADYTPGGRRLAPVDIDAELLRARIGMEGMQITPITEQGTVTINNLVQHLRDGYDMLYLVAHGALVSGEPRLWMEDSDGLANVVSGNELVERLNELPTLPRLVVLASCQSAGSGSVGRDTEQTLAALGPRLAEAGIPAVLAMQGNVALLTLEHFMPAFFRELQRDGLVDRAMTAARSLVRDANDWWMPVLFMRLRSGRIWYVPGFSDEQRGFEKWPALLRNMQRGRCTPILGPGMVETLLGTPHDIARRWAERYRFPMNISSSDDLPQVAQYLSVNQELLFPHEELGEYLRATLTERFGANLPADMQTSAATLDALLEAVGRQRQQHQPTEPHRMLARLPCPIYITTNPDNLLTVALQAEGKEPQVLLCPWNEEIEEASDAYTYQPDEQHPLVYHLFGRINNPASVVLTEDNYFDYLIGVTRNNRLIPDVVRRALADTALLFLGFQLDSWQFRVLYRSLMNREGRRRRSRYTHIAAQIEPEEGRIREPEGARRYLERYFEHAAISIFWGSVEDFTQALAEQLQARG